MYSDARTLFLEHLVEENVKDLTNHKKVRVLHVKAKLLTNDSASS